MEAVGAAALWEAGYGTYVLGKQVMTLQEKACVERWVGKCQCERSSSLGDGWRRLHIGCRGAEVRLVMCGSGRKT